MEKMMLLTLAPMLRMMTDSISMMMRTNGGGDDDVGVSGGDKNENDK